MSEEKKTYSTATSKSFLLRLEPYVLDAIMKIAEQEKISARKVITKAILTQYEIKKPLIK